MFDQVPLDTLFSVPQRNGLTKPKRLRGEGVKMVNMGELFAERRIQELPMDRVPCSERELETNRLEKGDLLFARQSLTLEGAGQSSIFLGDQEDVVFESHLIRCRLDKSRVDPLYYFYFFESKFGKQRIGSIVEQVASAGIRGSDLIRLPVFLPSLSDQKAIAHILGTLDDKIELNQKMNQTLEEIAKAIFKSWFVDFDPVRAKAEGRPTGLPSEISDLFPDELVESEIGEIPKGWVLASIDKACEKIYSGGTPSTKVPEYWGGSHGWLSSGETRSAFIIDTEKKITEAGIKNSTTKAARRFDTVIASAGQGKTRGQTSLLLLDTYVNQSVVTLRAKTEIGALLLFFNLSGRYEEFRRYSDSSSSRGSLPAALVKGLPFVIPTENLTTLFQKSTLPIVDKIELNLKENEVLSALRDALLPKLISGELRIPDAEKFLQEAGI